MLQIQNIRRGTSPLLFFYGIILISARLTSMDDWQIADYNLTLWTYLAPSKLCDGVGVFALMDIPQDTLIFEPGWQVQVYDSEMPDEVRKYLSKMTYNNEKGYWIDDSLRNLGQQYYINHSHKPNVAYERGSGRLYAISDIIKDTELTDYYFPGERDWLI